tara:strand:- start:22074 stop:22238 length:165 start_codon:yes stop_codon:yes gene_type:complete
MDHLANVFKVIWAFVVILPCLAHKNMELNLRCAAGSTLRPLFGQYMQILFFGYA